MDSLFQHDDGLPGFRLHKLEIYNWGTFDGAVYSVKPSGQTTLLVGENGSGKSTLIDALLTLLVRPSLRNYNVAAGAKKNERDERSYVKGAFDRTVTEDGRPVVQYLRPEVGHYTVLLACFRNQRNGRAFTLTQVLYQNSEGSIDKVYAFSEGERSITRDLIGLSAGSGIGKTLRQRDFRTTTSYKQYFTWLQRATGIRPKAMDVFNQTVAVKDVQRLDRFIRHHMLEAKPWNEKVGQLLAHFHELSETHRVLQKVRTQQQLLRPVVDAGQRYTSASLELQNAEAILNATDTYFSQQAIALLSPHCEALQSELTQIQRDIDRLTESVAEHQRDAARLEVEIELSGGARLRELPGLIKAAEKMAGVKQQQREQFEQMLVNAGVEFTVDSAQRLNDLAAVLSQRKTHIRDRRREDRAAYDALQFEIGQLHRQLSDDQQQLKTLDQRKGNLPVAFTDFRANLCEQLNVSENEIPFAAELIAVSPEHRQWEGSIESALHDFARSLLIPAEHYVPATRWIESELTGQNALLAEALRYQRVGTDETLVAGPVPSADSLVHKLVYRDNHHLTPWIRAEIRRRFDLLCCQTLEEFSRAASPAMTATRHIKNGCQSHLKDRQLASNDRRDFVLGWENTEKRELLSESIDRFNQQLEQLDDRRRELNHRIDHGTRAIREIEECQSVDDYDRIDHSKHAQQAQQYRLEKQALETADDQADVLRSQLSDCRAQLLQDSGRRDGLIAQQTRLARDLKDGEKRIQRCHAVLEETQAPLSEKHEAPVQQIEEHLDGQMMTLDTIDSLPAQFVRRWHQTIETLRGDLAPVAKSLTGAMVKFLKKFPDEKTDLDAHVESLDSFRALFDRIERDDLPSQELRFKQRLNEKVLQEIGLFRAALETEREEVCDKIRQLNRALQRLEYRPGTFMQLEPRDVKDQEISDFRDLLNECLEGPSDQVSEATFDKIQSLVERLRDAENTRWRDKVVDVRNWFDFAAREQECESGLQRGYYEDSTGQSGGEKAKLAFTILVAAIAYQYDIDTDAPLSDRLHFVMVDEMFSRADDHHACYALELFKKFGLQLLIVAPLDAKARITEPYVGTYLHVVKDRDSNRSELLSMTATQLHEATTDALLKAASKA